jgi:hypothetical protein
MPRFRKKPVEIEATRLTKRITIHTREGDVVGEPGDFLITGVEGEQYPCGCKIFLKTYEPVDPEAEHVYSQAEQDSDVLATCI